jgi:hypothetical protein
MEGTRPGTSASLLSISTPSSTFDIEDLDSDLQSIQSEVMRHEGERLAHKEIIEKDFIQELVETITASPVPETVDLDKFHNLILKI